MDKNYLKKLGFRFLIITIVFLTIHFIGAYDSDITLLDKTTIFHYLSCFVLFIVAWETNDWLIKRIKTKKSTNEILTHGIILGLTTLVVLVIAAVIYYLGIFSFNTICGIDTENPWSFFKTDMLRAFVLVVVFSAFNQFYWVSRDKKNLEMSILVLNKEVLTSKYSSLKSQISPHFLFNSLNALTSLIYEDRDLASDFVTRLASCYRYILDNREEELASLDKEIQFLDSFIFMMRVRHNVAIVIETNIQIEELTKWVPTLSIQMLVENALKHNYYSKDQPIIINVYTESNRIIIKNSIKKRIDSQESTQVGLANIKKRYAFYTLEEVIIEDNNKTFIVSMPLLSSKSKKS